MANFGQVALSRMKGLPVSTGNLFNKDDVLSGCYYDQNGSLINHSNYVTPNPIQVQGGKTYVTNVANYYHVAFWDSDRKPITGLANGTWNKTITVPANGAYLTFGISITDNLKTLMLCEGTVIPAIYQPFGYSIADAFKSQFLTAADLLRGGVGKNLFDKNKVRTGYEVYVSGEIRSEANSAVTDYIPVQGLSNIYVSGLTPYVTGNNRYYYFFDKDKYPLGAVKTISMSLTEALIAVPKNAIYIVLTLYQRKTSAESVSLESVQIEEGSIKSNYEPYIEGLSKIKGVSLPKGGSGGGTAAVPTEGKIGLFFGDSITETATVSDDGVDYQEGTRVNWPTFAKDTLKLGAMWNYAKSGAAYRDRAGVSSERQKISVQVNTAIANSRPGDIIVVACGTNDGSSNIGDYDTAMSKANLTDLDRTNLYEALRWTFWTLRKNYPNAVCYASTPLQRASYEPVTALNDAIRKMAARYNFILIDAANESGIVREFEVESAAGRYLSDGLHPNTTGQILMSKLFSRVILNTYR